MAGDLESVQFAEASAMERHFLEGRIRLLYYLFAFALALATISGTALNANQPPPWLFLGLSCLCGLLASVGWAVFATIRNWNLALGRYDAWKRRVLATAYSDLEIRMRMNSGLPERYPVFSAAAAVTVELPALLVAIGALVASAVLALSAMTTGAFPAWVCMAGPAVGVMVFVAYAASPDRVTQMKVTQWLWVLLGKPEWIRSAYPLAYTLVFVVAILLATFVFGSLASFARSL